MFPTQRYGKQDGYSFAKSQGSSEVTVLQGLKRIIQILDSEKSDSLPQMRKTYKERFIPQMFISPHYGADALLGAGEIAVNRQTSSLVERTLAGGQKT